MSKTTYGEIEEILDDIEIYFMNANNFDVLEFPPSDHRFLSSNAGCSSLAQLYKASLIRKIKEEWKIVEAQNPSNMYIRVYKDSMEVMRVAVIAEKESSFHHGLFFFDVRFPRVYPSKPPQLFYHSFGESQYSNTLHQNGAVSLDLLNIQWHEMGKEPNVGEPKKSAILELLVFIRQSVLMGGSTNPNSDSADYNKPVEVHNKKSVSMKTCGAMLRMLRTPPKGFEAFVAGFFRTRAHRILLNFRYAFDISADSEMKLLFFRLVRAFEKNGTYCRHHYSRQQYDQALKEERAYGNPFNY